MKNKVIHEFKVKESERWKYQGGGQVLVERKKENQQQKKEGVKQVSLWRRTRALAMEAMRILQAM